MSDLKKPVVVGYDDSKQSEFTLRWAARVAERRGVLLRVVHATGVERPSVELARAGILEMYQRRAREIAEEGASRAREMARIKVEAIGMQGSPAAALVICSTDASLVVIGHHGRALLPESLLGAAAFTIAIHAACPVAIIRQSPRPLPSMAHPIVVGVDGSQHAVIALDEAAFLASDTGSFLRVVVAWQPPEKSLWSTVLGRRASGNGQKAVESSSSAAADAFPRAWAGPHAALYDQVIDDLSKRAEETAQWAIERVQQRFAGLKVESMVVEGPAATAIINAAADASMIAVGARGHGDLKSVLLGSVSRKVVQRAPCPVYVIR